VDFKTKPPERGVGKIVLVVDENPAIRKKLTAAFLSNGLKSCAEAENGKKAIELASKVTPDIIVLDLSMPVMNALEAAPKLREIFPDKPIILFTLYGDSLSKTEASKAGVSLVLSKTVPLATLVDKAHESVGG
jgi:CheY-like chemotaxis protein